MIAVAAQTTHIDTNITMEQALAARGDHTFYTAEQNKTEKDKYVFNVIANVLLGYTVVIYSV